LVLADVGAVAPHVRSGALHLIGNAGSKRAAAFSHVPTMAEEGVADFVWESWQGVVAPAATPGEIVDLLKSSLVRMRASAAFREGLEGLGFEPIDEGPEAFSAVLRDETERFRKLVSRSRTAEKE
jgi:tripartite-type tricarboxylate transporter receptor subunit TctC